MEHVVARYSIETYEAIEGETEVCPRGHRIAEHDSIWRAVQFMHKHGGSVGDMTKVWIWDRVTGKKVPRALVQQIIDQAERKTVEAEPDLSAEKETTNVRTYTTQCGIVIYSVRADWPAQNSPVYFMCPSDGDGRRSGEVWLQDQVHHCHLACDSPRRHGVITPVDP